MPGRMRRLLRPLDAVAEPSRAAVDVKLEQMVEGLQDTNYLQAQRVDADLIELRRRLEPAEVAESLSDDACRRGV